MRGGSEQTSPQRIRTHKIWPKNHRLSASAAENCPRLRRRSTQSVQVPPNRGKITLALSSWRKRRRANASDAARRKAALRRGNPHRPSRTAAGNCRARAGGSLDIAALELDHGRVRSRSCRGERRAQVSIGNAAPLNRVMRKRRAVNDNRNLRAEHGDSGARASGAMAEI